MSTVRPVIIEQYSTNKYLNNKLPDFITLYKTIEQNIHKIPNLNGLLVSYETLISYNTLVMGMSINKQIERYNKINKRVNSFIEIINNQVLKLIKKKKKYFQLGQKQFNPKKENKPNEQSYINFLFYWAEKR